MFEKQYRSNDIKREIPTIIVGISLYLYTLLFYCLDSLSAFFQYLFQFLHGRGS